jgi:hypothetical protein
MSPHFERALRFAEAQQNGLNNSAIHDWTLSQLHALALEFQTTHDLAISAAAKIADTEGDEYERRRVEFIADGKHQTDAYRDDFTAIHAKRSVAQNIAALILKLRVD